MSDKFRLCEEFFSVPPDALDADPVATMRELFFRVGSLEQSLDEQRVQANADLRDMLLDILSLSDDITGIVERWGVTTKAQEATIMGAVVAVGRKLLAILKAHGVKPISTMGEILDPETSDVVETEGHPDIPENTVLREAQIGYLWQPYGILRRAKVVVSANERGASRGEEQSPEVV
jgi:molecular chaperone GrpE (heat shock protein)